MRNAIDIMTKPRIVQHHPITGEGCHIAGGQDAYDAWADAIGDDKEFSTDIILPMLIERLMCQNDAQVMIGEGRAYAACFLEYVGKRHPNLAEKCKEVATIFRKEAKCVMDMNDIKGGFDQDESAIKRFAQPEVRKKIIKLIRLAKAYDLEARTGMEEIYGLI